MVKDTSQLQLYQHFLSFFLPEGILDYFEPVWMETQSLDSRESKKDILYSSSLHIYLDERDNRPEDMRELRPNGFTEETVITDFPVRDRKAVRVKLHGWYKAVNRCTIREIKSARDAIKSREDNVLNYFLERSTNASAESLNSKMKGFRAQLRGVSDLPFFMFRLCVIFG